MKRKRSICVIPARIGSKRIPEKNIKFFLGKPIIAYSIEAALRSELFDEVMVSTDSIEIANIAKSYGAKVPFLRSKINSDDAASTMDVIHEVLNSYKVELNIEFRYACCIYATAPLIRVDKLEEGFHELVTKEFTSVFPSTKFNYPIWRSIELSEDNRVKMVWPEHEDTRTQDLSETYHDAGQWYWFDLNKLSNWTWPENSGMILLSSSEVQDIDSMSDWELAELKHQLINKN